MFPGIATWKYWGTKYFLKSFLMFIIKDQFKSIPSRCVSIRATFRFEHTVSKKIWKKYAAVGIVSFLSSCKFTLNHANLSKPAQTQFDMNTHLFHVTETVNKLGIIWEMNAKKIVFCVKVSSIYQTGYGRLLQTAPESGSLDSQDDAIEMNQATRYSQSISPLCKLNISNSQTNMIYHESSCL